MRTLLLILGGALLGIAVAAVYFRLEGTGEAFRVERGGLPGRLEARGAEVEASAPDGRPVPGPRRGERGEGVPRASLREEKPSGAPAEPPLLSDLLESVEGRDAQGLASQLERLLLSGPAGYPALEEFLSAVLGPPDFPLLADAKLALAAESLALRRPEEFADLARHLLFGPAATASGPVRAQLLKFLPAFLALHGGRFPELREDLARALERSLEASDPRLDLAQTLAGLRDLGLEPRPESLESVIRDPARRHQHGLALRELGRRGDGASLQAILRAIEEAADSGSWCFEQAFGALAAMDLPEAGAALEGYLSSPADEHRNPAIVAYFSQPRDSGAFSVAVEYLRSDAATGWKNLLLERLAEKNPEILGAIRSLGPGIGISLDPGAPRLQVTSPPREE